MSSHSKFLSYFAELLSDLDDAHVSYDALRSRLDALERAIDDRLSDDTLQRRIQDLEVCFREFQNKVDARFQSLERRLTDNECVLQTHARLYRDLSDRLSSVAENHVSRLCELERKLQSCEESRANADGRLRIVSTSLEERMHALEAKFTSSTHDASSPPDSSTEEPAPVVEEFVYDWSSIPSEFDYAVTDADGTRSYFHLEPELPDSELFWFSRYEDNVPPKRTSQRIPADESRCPNWRASLRKRPDPTPVPFPEPASVPEPVMAPAPEPAPSPLVVEGGMYLTAEHHIVGPMSPALEPDFPGQLQGPLDGNPDNLQYFLPNGNFLPDDHSNAHWNRDPWSRILRPLVDYRPDHPRDPQFAPGEIPGDRYDSLTEGKFFRLTGEYRIPREGEFWIAGNLRMNGSNWNLSPDSFSNLKVISFMTKDSLGKNPKCLEADKRLIVVEYPAPTKDA